MMADLAERRKEMLDSMMREAIYEGAVTVLTGHGLGGLTMDRVAAAAGMAKGSLYNHFRNKKRLLEFVHERALRPVLEAAEEIVDGPLPPARKLETVLRKWRTDLEQRRELFEFLSNDVLSKGILQESAQATRASAIALVAKIIRQGVQEQAFRPLDPDLAAEIFISVTIGMFEHESVMGVTRSVEEVVDVLMRVFLFGISASQR